jgi:hypothetical protein
LCLLVIVGVRADGSKSFINGQLVERPAEPLAA